MCSSLRLAKFWPAQVRSRLSWQIILLPASLFSVLAVFLLLGCAQKPDDATQGRPRRATLTNAKFHTVKAGGDLQAALNAAQYGDTIILQAGATFRAPSSGRAFVLPAKSGGTGTDADYITVQSSAVAALPAGRVSAADKVNMAKIVAVGPAGCLVPGMNSKYWKFVGIEFTNVSDGSEATRVGRLINQDTPQGSTDAPEKWGDHFVFDRCYFHSQEDGTTNYDRTAEVAIGWNGGAITITRSRFSGFGGVHNGQVIPSGCFWSNFGGPYLLDDNYMAATFNPIFLGAGENGSPNQATISPGATLTQATLSNVSNLQVGDKIAMEVHLPTSGGYDNWLYGVKADGATDKLTYSGHGFMNGDACYVRDHSDSAASVGLLARDNNWSVYYIANKTANDFQLSLTRGGAIVDLKGNGSISVGANGHKYCNAVVQTIDRDTKTITYSTAVRWEGDARPDAVYPYQYVSPSSQLPMAGGRAIWRGYQVHDFTFTHNTIDIDHTTAVYVKKQTGSNAKGFMEIKNLITGLIEGNIFTGYPTSLAFTNASQNSTSPWVSVRDITIKSNLYQSFTTMLVLQLISGTMSDEGSNIQFINNLGYNIYDVNALIGQSPVILYTAGGSNNPLVARHNTVINKPTQDGGSAWLGILPMPNPHNDTGSGITFEDNIIYYSRYGVNTGGKPWNKLFPHFVERKNVWIDDAVWTTGPEYITGQYGHFPKSFYAKSDAAVRFVDPSKRNYRLADTSPYRKAASDGTDVGVDMDALRLALGPNNPEGQ